ncbi:MAG: DUF6146 family protein [Bacteroidales bacterium]
MKRRLLTTAVLLGALLIACSPSRKMGSGEKSVGAKLEQEAADSTSYEVIIFDPGFSGWFATNRKPEWYYSKEYLENWNRQYITAWNDKVRNRGYQLFNPDNPFIQEIYWDPRVDYGLEVNYQLYHYFLFVEDTWGPILHYRRR